MKKKETRKKDAPAAGVEESVDEMIARRAYELSQSEESGSDEDNWLRAERELRPSRLEDQGTGAAEQ